MFVVTVVSLDWCLLFIARIGLVLLVVGSYRLASPDLGSAGVAMADNGEHDEYYDEEEEEYEEEYEEEEESSPTAVSAAAAAKSAPRAGGADEDQDVDEEEDEEEEEEEIEAAQDWAGLQSLPERQQVLEVVRQLKEEGRKQLTILLLGKSGQGKSSTVNSLLGEKAAAVAAFKMQPDTETTTMFARQVAVGDPTVDGFRVNVIDTCGLEDPESGDTVNYAAIQRIAEDVRGTPLDVVLYVDRLDLYRVDALDRRIMEAIGDTFGRGIWHRTLLVLTHGSLPLPPPGTTYEVFVDRRIQLLQRAVRSPLFRPALSSLLAENSDSCKKDAAHCRILPDGTRWVEELWVAAADMALSKRPYVWRQGLARRPNRRFKWLIPVVFAAQYLVFKRVLQPLLQRDEDDQAAADQAVWQQRAAERKRLGIGPPLKPTAENAWRLEQMYDDD